MEINVEIPFNKMALSPKARREKALKRIIESLVDDVCSEDGDGYSAIDVVEVQEGQESRLGDFEVSKLEAVEIGKMFVEKGYKASIDYHGSATKLLITSDPDFNFNSRIRREYVRKSVEIGKDTVL